MTTLHMWVAEKAAPYLISYTLPFSSFFFFVWLWSKMLWTDSVRVSFSYSDFLLFTSFIIIPKRNIFIRFPNRHGKYYCIFLFWHIKFGWLCSLPHLPGVFFCCIRRCSFFVNLKFWKRFFFFRLIPSFSLFCIILCTIHFFPLLLLLLLLLFVWLWCVCTLLSVICFICFYASLTKIKKKKPKKFAVS